MTTTPTAAPRVAGGGAAEGRQAGAAAPERGGAARGQEAAGARAAAQQRPRPRHQGGPEAQVHPSLSTFSLMNLLKQEAAIFPTPLLL